MFRHACPRCGLDARSSHGSWVDRHPAAAVCFALPAGYTLVGVILAYPWFFVPILLVVAAFWVDRRQRRRAAIAARTDHEHREQMARTFSLLPVKSQVSRLAGADNLAGQRRRAS
jgi:hypothetical protein